MIKGAVLGSPITHSLSPVLHSAAFEFLGIEGTYSAIEVAAGTLQDFVSQRGSEFDYLSLTMPLKEEVLSLEVSADSLTTRIQSGNTLIHRDGSWNLTSTDGSGLVAALSNAGLTQFESVLIRQSVTASDSLFQFEYRDSCQFLRDSCANQIRYFDIHGPLGAEKD